MGRAPDRWTAQGRAGRPATAGVTDQVPAVTSGFPTVNFGFGSGTALQATWTACMLLTVKPPKPRARDVAALTAGLRPDSGRAGRRGGRRLIAMSCPSPLVYPSYSLRICLIRAIASSTACSGVMPSVDDAVDRLWPRPSCQTGHSASRRDRDVIVLHRARRDLHRRSHTVRIAGIEPERLVEQLGHRRQQALAGEVEIVGKPAFRYQEADELLGDGEHCRRP